MLLYVNFLWRKETLAEVEQAVEQGYTVILPEKETVLNDWKETGYLILNPETGAGAYRISGGLSGGSTSTAVTIAGVCAVIVLICLLVLLAVGIVNLLAFMYAAALGLGLAAQAVCALLFLLMLESYGGLAVRISNLTEAVRKQAAGDASQEEYILWEFLMSAAEIAVAVGLMAVFAYIEGRPSKGEGETGSGGGKDQGSGSGSEDSGGSGSGNGSGDSGGSGSGSGSGSGGKDTGSGDSGGSGSGSGEEGKGETGAGGSGGISETIELSNSNIQHIKKHTFAGMAEQAQYLTDEQLANKLNNTSFFNKNWSQDEVIKYTQEAYNILRGQRKTGLQSVKINGEIINVFIKNDGTFDTAYGVYHFTVEDFR